MANREIKFRAWNTETNKMSKSFEMGHVVSFTDEKGLGQIMSCFTPGLELMQYTGLKDKNGKEIYEGDYLKFTSSKVKVVFDQGGFGYEFLISEERMVIPFLGHSSFDSIMERCEII